MINAEVLELKKRFRKDKASFYRVTGCYVNEKKEKVYTFNKQFLNLPEQELFKYLEIATKTLSGKIGNNLLNIEFPIEEEKTGGSQFQLDTLRHSEADDEELLEALYDKIIETYQHPNHYLITLFFDKYDIPVKTKDKQKLDDSEEVFHYIICAICPVELTTPSLGYIDKDTGLAITDRNWIVQAPETGFMYPEFNERSTDIHSFLFYTKNAKLPHMEIIADTFGCECVLTSSQKKSQFNDVISTQLSDLPDNEIDNVLIDIEYKIQQLVEINKAEHGETAVLKLNKKVLTEAMSDISLDDDKKEGIVRAIDEMFGDEDTDSSVLVSSSNIKIGEVRAEKKVIAEALSQKEKELSSYKNKPNTKRYETKNINGIDYILVPTEKNTTIVDGVEYVLVAADNLN